MSLRMTSHLPDPHYDAAFYDGIPAKRFFAWLVDVALIVVASLLLGLLTLSAALWVWPLTQALVSFFYRWLTIRTFSATPGMRLMNIELRGRTGAHLTSTEAAVHTGTYLLCAIFILAQLLNAGLIFGRERHRGIPDEVVGTVAINRPR